MDSQTVFVVVEERCPDYRIVAVMSNRPAAESLAAKLDGRGWVGIEEFTLDSEERPSAEPPPPSPE